MSTWRKVCRYCLASGVPKRSARVALIVGTVLNLINQGDALLGHAHLSILKLALTFAVPYCVATYGAVAYRLTLESGAHDRPRAPTAREQSSVAE